MILIDELITIENNEHIKPQNSLYHKFLHIKKHFEQREDMIKIIFPLFTLHNHEHSDAIIHILTSFDHKRLLQHNPLNKYEIFLLISAAYLHDIGMMIIEKEDIQSYNEVDANNIREKHHIRSAEYILDNQNVLNIDEFEAFNLAMICKGHRKENLYNNEDYEPVPCAYDQDKFIRINLLAAFLRMADELDMNFNRVQWKMKKFLEMYHSFDTITNLHWYKHYYTKGFTPIFIHKPNELTKLSIEISFRLSDKSYEKSFSIPFVIQPIQKQIDYLQPIFNRYGFSMDIKKSLNILINRNLKLIPDDLYDDIFKFLLINKNITVLIVDDDALTRNDFSIIIKDMGYHVDSAADSKSALKKIQANFYHLILLDLKMPDLKGRTSNEAGLELLKLIKNMKKNHIVVIVSALEQSSLIIDCLNEGADSYIIKDMSIDKIVKRLENGIRMNYYILEEN